MCSLNDDEGGCENFFLPEKSSLRELTTCRSCTNEAVVVLRNKDAYCKQCFLNSETHKFRAALGKTKMMKPQDKVLVAYSGSQSSTALLHLLYSGVSEKHHKKLLFSVNVFFIEEGAIFYMTKEERLNLVSRIKDTVQQFDFPLTVISLSECFEEVPEVNSNFEIDSLKDSKLVKLFEGVKTFTSKADLLYTLRQRLIRNVANQLHCNKIFTAEVGNDLAVKLLANFSLGRGNEASFETGFCDGRNPQCKIMRPLRDFLKKEIVFYNRFYNIDSVNTPTFTTKAHANTSIHKLTEKFITDLQVEFPSTVYTIFRTGEKLSANTNISENNINECLLCGCQVPTSSVDDYCAIDALNFSKNLSKKETKTCQAVTECCGSNSCSQVGVNLLEVNLRKNFCYGCMEIMKDLDVNSLPKDLISSGIKRRNFKEMEKEISEFLIED